MKILKSKRSAYQTSVVTRLRATFLFLALACCCAAAFSVWQLSSLDHAHTRLTEGAVPTLRHTHELRGQLSGVLELAARADTRQSSEQLQALLNQLSESTESIKASIQSDRWPEYTALKRDQIVSLLNGLKKIHETGVSNRLQVLQINESLNKHGQQLRQTRENFRGLIEPLLIESAAKLELTDGEFKRQDQTLTATQRAGISSRIIKQMNLTQIGYRFSALVDSAENQPNDRLNQFITDWAERLRFEFSGVVQVLIRLPASKDRQSLASELSNTRDLIFSNTGIVSLLTSLAKTSAIVEKTNGQRLAVIASIERHADDLVSSASGDADNASADFDEILASALTVMTVTIVVVLLVLVAVWLLVVERQISRRMSRLTSAVSAIADGDIDTPVDVTGHDELSEMASALQVFKSNATELRRSNEELESFAYAAAHDMRSPLRAIENLAMWTLEDAGDDLSNDCRDNLEKLVGRANRLSKLQADLLDYSKVGKADADQKTLDLRLHVHNIRELLDPDRQFTYEIDVPLQDVRVPETPLRQILINLITNAIKHHDRDTGTISVQAKLTGARLVVSVSDDGPGIEPQFHDRIFKLFQSLQSRDVVEGSGLGLSFVMKHVSRYGGRIQVFSDPSQQRGTTFAFDLPADLVDPDFEETSVLQAQEDRRASDEFAQLEPIRAVD